MEIVEVGNMMSVTVFLSRIDIYFMTIVKHFKVNLIDLKESLHPVPSKWFEVFSCSVGIGIFSERKHNHSKGKKETNEKRRIPVCPRQLDILLSQTGKI